MRSLEPATERGNSIPTSGLVGYRRTDLTPVGRRGELFGVGGVEDDLESLSK